MRDIIDDGFFAGLLYEHPYLLDTDCLPITRSEARQEIGDIDIDFAVQEIKQKYYHVLEKEWHIYESALRKVLEKR